MNRILRKNILRNGNGLCVIIPTKWVRQNFNGSKSGVVDLVIKEDRIEIIPVKN